MITFYDVLYLFYTNFAFLEHVHHVLLVVLLSGVVGYLIRGKK